MPSSKDKRVCVLLLSPFTDRQTEAQRGDSSRKRLSRAETQVLLVKALPCTPLGLLPIALGAEMKGTMCGRGGEERPLSIIPPGLPPPRN